MQAECYVRLNQPEKARPFLEQIRSRAGITGTPETITLQTIEDELKKSLF